MKKGDQMAEENFIQEEYIPKNGDSVEFKYENLRDNSTIIRNVKKGPSKKSSSKSVKAVQKKYTTNKMKETKKNAPKKQENNTKPNKPKSKAKLNTITILALIAIIAILNAESNSSFLK